MLDLTAAFAAFPVLETERFTLRAIRDADAPAIFAIMTDERVMRYFGMLPMQSPDQALRRVQGIATDFQERAGIRWAIAHRADGQFLGTCGFWRIMETHHRAEIGYELASDYWGRGVMTEALTGILDFGFTTMGLHSVEAQIHPGNAGSRRVLEKLGFVQEGYFRENYYDPVEQQFTDTAVFSLLHTGWMQRT